MDETYIKMCAAAINEIQKPWDERGPMPGDRYVRVEWNGDEGDISRMIINEEGAWIVNMKWAEGFPAEELWSDYAALIYLPRQEDIQEMLIKDWGNSRPYKLLEAFSDWYIEANSLKGTDFSITEYWIIFYMEDAHNKTWTEKGWE